MRMNVSEPVTQAKSIAREHLIATASVMRNMRTHFKYINRAYVACTKSTETSQKHFTLAGNRKTESILFGIVTFAKIQRFAIRAMLQISMLDADILIEVEVHS
jgi:hypothetical protein